MADPSQLEANAGFYHGFQHQQEPQQPSQTYQQVPQFPTQQMPQTQYAQQQQYQDQAKLPRQPFTLNEALPYTPFTSVLPFDSDIINNPTIGSGPLALPVASHVSHDDFDSLNQDAEASHQSKRLEGSLELVQNLLKPEKITEFQFKTGPRLHPTSPTPHRNLFDGLSPFTRSVLENTSVSFRHSPTEKPEINGQTMSPRTVKPSPKVRRQETPKVVKHNPAALNSKASSQSKPRIEVHLPSRKDYEAANRNFSSTTSTSPPAAVPPPAQPQTVSLSDLMMKPESTSFSFAPDPPKAPPQELSNRVDTPRSPIDHKPLAASPHQPTLQEIPPAPQQPQTPVQPRAQEQPQMQPQPRIQTQPQIQPQPQMHSQPQVQLQPQAQGQPQVQVQPPVKVEAPPPPQYPIEVPPQIPTIKPPSPSASQQRAGISIELPSIHINRSEFLTVDDGPDAPAHLSVKRKTVSHRQGDDALMGDLSQRDHANQAFSDLRRCLQELYAAQMQATNQPGMVSQYITVTPDHELTMTLAAHKRVEPLLSKAIQLGCFKQAPVDDLLRVQGLSEASLKHADGLDLKLEDSWGEVEFGFWVNQLPQVELGLRAARTSLRVMCGGREEKQLYSEDIIQQGLDLFRNVLERIIQPLASMRSTDKNASLFRLCVANKKALGSLFTAAQRLLSLMADLMKSIDLSETVANALEHASFTLIFLGNATSDKDSAVGVQKFDALQSVAMNMLSQIFKMNEIQRRSILTSILADLEKLPVHKQSARQFKLSNGDTIMPVSALIMRLIQASAGKIENRNGGRRNLVKSLDGDEDDEDADGDTDTMNGEAKRGDAQYTVQSEGFAAAQHATAIQELRQLATPLLNSAEQSATYIVKYIVERALESSKSGETPYRNLLDLFVEDFTRCLSSPDWPAAELLLRFLMYIMIGQVDPGKNSATARNMALELLGGMAAAISKLRSHVRKIASNFEGSDADDLGRWLADLAATVLDSKIPPEKALNWLGPYRIVLEFLQDRVEGDQYLTSAISYLITDWAAHVGSEYENASDDVGERDEDYGRTAFRLRNMIDDSKWLSREYSFKSVSDNHAKLSYSIILLRSNIGSYFGHILNIVMGSMTTDQATVRSKSLKSINQVLEEDPSILDGDSLVLRLILQCSSDSSPQVRDSALGLIGKCMHMRPHLEEKMTPTVIQRFMDSGVGVRKRAMKLARDIYLGNQSKDVRSAIANGLLHRMQDPDEGVKELARQMIEEVWISPFYAHRDDDSVAFKQALTDHVTLIVQTVRQGNAAHVLDKVFQTILSPQSKFSDANARVCTRLVANMFDLVDNPESDDPSIPSGKDALQVLMVFAKADSTLFTFEQIRLLKPHIASVSSSEDLVVSRAVVVIYLRVLPQISSVHSQFLADVRKDLMTAVPKVTRSLLDDVVACLWVISTLLPPSEHLARLFASSLAGIQKIRALSARGPLDAQTIRKFDRYSLIVGMGGKHCDFDAWSDLFKKQFPQWPGGSVSKLMVDVLIPFTSPSKPEDIRKPALDGVGLVCQSNPRNFVEINVYKTFEQVFDEQTQVLESMILRSFREFLFTEERRSEQASAAASASTDAKRDLKVMGSTSFDDVASATTQRFLSQITRISLASPDDHALLAAEVLASINRQGLVHPKETGVTFITLETCPLTPISELAYKEHRALHEKHETVIEREYPKTVQAVFQYQRDIIKDPRGATENPFTPKLHLLTDVLKISKSKNRQKFLDKLVGQIDFDPAKLDTKPAMPYQVEFSRFIIENIAFFEYVTTGELQLIVAAMEKRVTTTGSGIAQAIESEIFQVRMDQAMGSSQQVDGAPPPGPEAQVSAPPPPSVDTGRLRQLCAGSMILSALWEARTHLRRLYGVSATRREAKTKAPAKDLTKAPVKVQGVTGEKFWDDMGRIMSSLGSVDLMIAQCRAFVELLNVDQEFKVAEEEDDDDMDADGEPRTPSPVEDDDDDATSDPQGRKRKAAGTPGGRKKRARSNSKARSRGRPRKNPGPSDEMGVDWA